MTAKTRLAKLESAVSAKAKTTDNSPLLRVVHDDRNGDKYFIDGVEVGYDVFEKAKRAQSEAWERLHPGEQEPVVINLVPRKDGDQ
jgi:outer membrane protease